MTNVGRVYGCLKVMIYSHNFQSSSTERNKEPTQRASSLKKRSDTAQRHVKWRGKRDEKQSVVTQGQGRKLSLAAWSRKPIDLFASGSDTYTPEERTTQDTGDAGINILTSIIYQSMWTIYYGYTCI